MQGVAGLATDEELLTAAKAGDQDCFARLIEPLIAVGFRLAVSMVNDPGLAEDLVQESSIRAWRGLRRLESVSRLRPWFLRIVANRARTLRQTPWWSVLVLPLSPDRSAGPIQQTDDRADLHTALQRLPADDRAAILLRFYEDLTSREIGQVLGISPEATRSRIHRALKQLRVELAEESI